MVEMSKPTSSEELHDLFDIHVLIDKLESEGEKEVKTRTIHYYAAKELLKPIGFGRNAKYSMLHVYRYKLIRLLQRQNLSLEQIRTELEDHQDVASLITACERLLEQLPEPSANTNEYSHEVFWGKVVDVVLAAGAKVIYAALILHYTLVQKNIAISHRLVILSALSYFILPMDAVPDMLPGLGYTDDLGALMSALITVKSDANVTILIQAKKRMVEWFARHRNLDKEFDEVDRHLRNEQKFN